MQKITSIPVPDEGTHLYSAYLNKINKVILLVFDNKRIIGIDSERFTNISTMFLDVACVKFV
jgi:hypothetical protein